MANDLFIWICMNIDKAMTYNVCASRTVLNMIINKIRQDYSSVNITHCTSDIIVTESCYNDSASYLIAW